MLQKQSGWPSKMTFFGLFRGSLTGNWLEKSPAESLLVKIEEMLQKQSGWKKLEMIKIISPKTQQPE
jgi:hypothetical protein